MTPERLAELIDGYGAALVLYARQWLRDPEDVVQEAFLKLVRQTAEPRDAVAWLYKVVRNGAIDGGKSARRRRQRESSVARPERWFVESAVDGIDSAAVMQALEQLPAEEREIIVARYWGGLNFEQIGAVAGCSASTAFRRYTSGVQSLRQHFGESSCPIPSTLS